MFATTMKINSGKITITYMLIVAILTSFSSVQAQTSPYVNTTKTGFNTGFKPDVSLSLSTSFNSFAYGGSFMSTSVIPSISFPVSKRLSVDASVGYSSIFMNNGSGSVFNSGPQSYGHISVTGDYLLSQKVSIRATAYKTFKIGQPQLENEPNSGYLDFSSQGVIIDAEYRVTDNFRINVGFEYREQKYPYLYPGMNPMNSGMGNNGSMFNIGNYPGIAPF